MYQLRSRLVLIVSILTIALTNALGQTEMPDVLKKGSVNDQLKFIEEKTRIYENYRAIREDMFQKLKVNITDTLSSSFNRIAALKNKTSELKLTIDSLNATLETTKTNLNAVTKSKNSIKILGIEVNKTSYNSIMWSIIGILIAVLAIGFVIFKRNISVTQNTKKELQDMKEEFETYRKTTREAREKMSMAHFNELKKLRGE
jgi:hypothetical protein